MSTLADITSTLGNIISTLGDTLSTPESAQYGYHEYTGDVQHKSFHTNEWFYQRTSPH